MTENNLSEVHFRDETVIDQPIKGSVLADAKRILEQNEDGSIKLVVQMDATHSGLLTNSRVYPGVHVRRSYKSYFSKDRGGSAEFDKPVLKHHDHYSDPIGRIIGGQFIKLKTGDAFKKDFLNPDTSEAGGRGSGVVRLTTEINDSDSIAKILDGRLVSVSSGHSTKSMTCSLCGKQLLDMFHRLFGGGDDEGCQHIPGKTYDDEEHKGLCFGITGPLTYHETSFVTIPGQPPSRLTKVDWEAVKMADSQDGPLVITGRQRGKKSSISSMMLIDSNMELDLLTAKDRKINSISISMAAADKVISSVFDGLPPEDDAAQDAEPEQIDTPEGNSGSENVSRLSSTSDASKKEKNSDRGDVIDNRQGTASKTEGSGKSNGRLGDDSYGESMADKNDTSVDDLQASIDTLTEDKANLQKDLEEKVSENESLKQQIEGKDSEISRLTDDMSQMQSGLAKDYATIVAQYRILLNKPGTEGLDDKEAKEAFIDDLAKRSVGSLRDSLNDLAVEYLNFCKEDKDKKDSRKGSDAEGVDVSGNKITSPALVSADDAEQSSEALSASKIADKEFGLN